MPTDTPAAPTSAANPHASAEQVEAAWKDSKLANVLYHDWEAATYDEKWSISFDQRCIDYARDRFSHVAGVENWPYPRALELGCGTGFFLLNLKLAGVLEEGHVTDLSPGMVEVAVRNGAGLGFDIDGRVADAESLPYPDDSFDLVVGHAVLHHIPDVELALREVVRVLKPGGRFVFAGEPTRFGDFVARRLSRLTWWATTRATRLPALHDWSRPKSELDASSRAAALEAVVDLHTFDPPRLRAMAHSAGAIEVSTKTDELTAAWFGWPVRTFEAAVPRDRLGFGWARFAFGTWKRLHALDSTLLSRVVPAGLFYNVEITGVKPSPPAGSPSLSGTPVALARTPGGTE
ncbi:class I SAM-dependent methyltransferase [Jatrophihabitans telluris]|uniref:Class I SAM-dependent methyltransferase n=1 Tax=Jatrophihabitans telluris TaxID=2038343 RepID=A0ABY4R310_9ACTN|nr:class I SAM-dependent methyltransferase [Jatrophihabitans telluris]UQX89912.1 class I SAM-dependent methyltransferase [Jatrophihabitans telluris]